jgi:hypothetical protein
MTRGLAYSRAPAAACSAAVAAACAALWLHAHVGSVISERQRRAAALEEGVSAQIAAMSEYDAERLEALRDRVGRARLLLGKEDTWGRLVRRFGERWAIEPGPAEERNGSAVQYGTFRLKSPVLADWPGIIETLGESEAMPGVGITGIEMRSGGGLEQRAFVSVIVRVAVQARRGDGNLAESR